MDVSAITKVRIYDGEANCSGFSVGKLGFRRITFADAPHLLTLYKSESVSRAFGLDLPWDMSKVLDLIGRDIERPYWTGYLLKNLACDEILGRWAIGKGYSPDKDLVIEGTYKAAVGEVQIGDFPESCELFYRTALLTMLLLIILLETK